MRTSYAALGLLAPWFLAGCILYEDRGRTVVPGRDPVSVSEIIAMSRGGTSDETIRKELSANGIESKVTADDIIAMKEAGVSESVIETALRTPRTVRREPTTVYERTVVRESYDPGFLFGLGYLFGWGLRWHGSCRPAVRVGARW